jgi:hypothetical protein
LAWAGQINRKLVEVGDVFFLIFSRENSLGAYGNILEKNGGKRLVFKKKEAPKKRHPQKGAMR